MNHPFPSIRRAAALCLPAQPISKRHPWTMVIWWSLHNVCFRRCSAVAAVAFPLHSPQVKRICDACRTYHKISVEDYFGKTRRSETPAGDKAIMQMVLPHFTFRDDYRLVAKTWRLLEKDTFFCMVQCIDFNWGFINIIIYITEMGNSCENTYSNRTLINTLITANNQSTLKNFDLVPTAFEKPGPAIHEAPLVWCDTIALLWLMPPNRAQTQW